MAFLTGHQHDVFVSYAHGPRYALNPHEDLLFQWSEKLVHDLRNQISVKLNTKDPARQADLWMDPNLTSNQPLTATIENAVKGSALLLVVMSPYYLASDWCGKEVEWFGANAGKDAVNRIFVVRAWWTDQTKWPATLRALDQPDPGYCLYPRREENADPLGYPVSKEKDGAEYLDALKPLVKDMTNKLLELNDHSAGRIPTAPSVFLGCMSDALQDEREELRDCLTARGFTVLPPKTEDPVDEASLCDAFSAHLSQSSALVLIANEIPPLWPRDQAGGFVNYQMQWANKSDVPCYLWLRVDDLGRVRKEEYRQFLETLSQQAEKADLGLRYANVEDFVEDIQRKLESRTERPRTGVEQLAVICSNFPADKDAGVSFREAIREAVRDTKREIFLFDFADTQEQLKLRNLGERIRDADTVLVLCFDQEWDWARGLIKQISGLSELRDRRKARLLVAGPQDRQNGLYDASVFGFKTVDGLHVAADQLKQVLKQEIHGL